VRRRKAEKKRWWTSEGKKEKMRKII